MSEYLNEEKYQKSKKKIALTSLVVLIIGCIIGGSLIFLGINKNKEVDLKYSNESKTELSNEIKNERAKLEKRKQELENKGVKYDDIAEYTDGEAYELKIITNVLDPSFDYYEFNEYKNNSITSTYCSLMEQKDENYSGYNKNFETAKNTPYFMFGAFIIFTSAMFAGMIFIISKRREIMAFQTQQIMPVAQEGMEKMAPTVAKVGKTMVDEMAPTMTEVGKKIAKEMAPAYGEIAKEIAKGVKEGMKEDKEDKQK